MPKVPLRRLLSRLTAVALSASPMAAAAAPRTALEPPDLEDCVVEDLPIDREHLDPQDAADALGRGLALALGDLRPLTATHLATSWSLSEDPLRRLAVAYALEWRFPLVGDAVVIDHLSRDPMPQVRAAAARAAWIRRPQGGDQGVLDRLSDDPDPLVRAIATSMK